MLPKRTKYLAQCILAASLLSAIGCDSYRLIVEPDTVSGVRDHSVLGPYLGIDPCPTCDGIFVGEPYTLAECSAGAYGPDGDVDQDGLADGCELVLARGFAPELALSASDPEPSREPYWAARLDGTRIRVFYAIGYHQDGGSWQYPCYQCTAHFGDSEWIALTLQFDSTTLHWLVDSAYYSQHGGAPAYSGNALEYPTGVQYSYPRSWVAWGKHANYPTEASCDAGGILGYDDCPGNSVRERIFVGSLRNLGSNNKRLVNCVRSTVISSTYQECFWTASTFTGWWGVIERDLVEPYKLYLQQQGFIPYL